MREIKFRGYSLKYKTWIYGFAEVITYPDKKIYFINQFSDWGLNIKLEVEEKSVAQFTGLTDKNGKEIYEGDILEFTEVDEDSCFGREETNIVEVKWLEDIAQYRAVFKSGRRVELYFVLHLPTIISSEIIGNIFSDPELLTPQYKVCA